MTRTIQYIPKHTAAKTEYREISDADLSWVLDQLAEYMVVMATLSTSKSELIQGIVNDFWRGRTNQLPKGKDGKNSPESMVGGILENFRYKKPTPQYNLTDKQCDAIEYISKWMHALNSELENKSRFTDIVFQ